VTVSLPLRALLPDGYVRDLRLRLRCYQELAESVNEQALEARARGLVDRFGPLPRPAEELVYSLRVRLLAASAGVLAVETERTKDVIVVRLPLGHGLDLGAVARQWRGGHAGGASAQVTFSPTRLYVHRHQGWQQVLEGVLRELGRLQRRRQAIPA
jgi:transcription-repair coupling factor (superfamily II helicase)